MITFLVVLIAFTTPLAIHSPESESLRNAARPVLAQRLRRRAGTLSLGIVMIALAAATFEAGALSIDARLENLLAMKPRSVLENGKLFQIVTSNFVHFDLPHLVSNLFVLMFLSAYEWRAGARRYLSVFVIAAVASSMIELVLFPPDITVMGASAGICGVAAAYFLDHDELSVREWTVGLAGVLVLVAACTFLGQQETPGVAVDWVGHLVGALVGSVYVRLCRAPAFTRIPA